MNLASKWPEQYNESDEERRMQEFHQVLEESAIALQELSQKKKKKKKKAMEFL